MTPRIYVRVSTDEQAAEGFSLQAQERAGRLYCELHNLGTPEIYIDDGYSGTTAERPAFKALLNDLVAGDVVLIHKLDRFARNTALLLATLQQFERREVHFVSVAEQIDFGTPIGKVMLTLLASFAQYYVDNLRLETAKGHREKARRGLWVGSVPFGYQKVAGSKGQIEPSPDAPTVQLIYELYTTGGYSFGDLAAELGARGLTAYDWQTKERQQWQRENIRVILRSRAYLGYVSAGGKEYPGLHEPLVSAEVWATAQQLRDERTNRRLPQKEPGGTLVGLARCARCGGKLWYHIGGGGGSTRSYICPARRHGRCDAPASSAERTEAQIAELLELLPHTDGIRDTCSAVWLDGGEVVALTPVAPYEKILSALGWALRMV